MNQNTKNDIEFLERKYRKNNYEGTMCGKSSVRFITGNTPILINASHAVCHPRAGKNKRADAYTGAMAEWLCEQTKAHGCIRCYNDQCDPNYDPSYDPNYDSNSDPNNDHIDEGKEYRDNLGVYCKEHNIKLIIDLHGTSDSQIVCEIGTNGGKNLLDHRDYVENLKTCLSTLGKKVEIDRKFCASKPYNLSRYVSQNYGIPSIQLEIGYEFRWSPENRMEFLRCLSSFILASV